VVLAAGLKWWKGLIRVENIHRHTNTAPMSTRTNSPFSVKRFTKRPGRKRKSPARVRLTNQEHQQFCKLIRGGSHAAPGRLRALAHAINDQLTGAERVEARDTYYWLTYRIRPKHPMLLTDAAKIFIAGARLRPSDEWTSPSWYQDVSNRIPIIPRFHSGHGVPGRFEGIYDKPFIPVMVPLEYIRELSDDLANLVIERDDGKRRPIVGERIEAFLRAKITQGQAGLRWNDTALFAIREVCMRVLFAHYYRGRFGALNDHLDSMITNAAVAIEREMHRILSDPDPGAFDRAMQRLSGDIQTAREAHKIAGKVI